MKSETVVQTGGNSPRVGRVRAGWVFSVVSGLLASGAAALPIVQEWFVPQPEAQLR